MPTPAAAKPQCQLCAGSKPWSASQSLNIGLCARKPVTSGAKKAPEVDAHVEDREAGIAALVVGRVEPAGHGADVGLEQAGAERDQRQPSVESLDRRNRQREVSAGDDCSADQDRAIGPEVTVGDEAAGDRQHVDGHRVVAVDACRFHRAEAEPAARDRGDDEQRQQGAHAVVGEALPHLGEEERRESQRLPGEARGLGRYGRGYGVGGSVGRHSRFRQWLREASIARPPSG